MKYARAKTSSPPMGPTTSMASRARATAPSRSRCHTAAQAIAGERLRFSLPIPKLTRQPSDPLGLGPRPVELADHEVEGRLRPVDLDNRPSVRWPVRVPRRLERLIVEGERLANREGLRGFPSCLQEVLERLWPLLGLPEVAGEDLAVLHEPLGVERLESLADGPVEVRPPVGPDRLVGDLLRHSVLERVRQLGEEGLLANEVDGLQLAEGPLTHCRGPHDPIDDPPRELPADDRGHIEHLARIRAESLDPHTDHVLDRVGEHDIVERRGQDQPGALAPDHPRLLARAEELLQEEGVALRSAKQERLQRLRKRVN